MLSITNCSVQGFVVAVRWARMNNFPEKVKDLTECQSKKIQLVADEYDKRHNLRK
jgi:hypothetical protein